MAASDSVSQRRAIYLASLPERLVRSTSAVAAGLLREISDVSLPAAIRRTHLYHALVDTTLRFLIEQVGNVQGAYPTQDELSEDFLFRRTAGNGIELMGILAFHASPVWVLAALADVSGAGRLLLPEITAVLQEEGLLQPGERFETVDQMLDGFEQTTGTLANALNAPPLDIPALRQQWRELQSAAAKMPSAQLPTAGALQEMWQDLKREAARQNRSTFAVSSLMALSTLASAPEAVLALTRAVPKMVLRTGKLVGENLMGHYRDTLREMQRTGYLAFGKRELQPYLRAAAEQFSPGHRSLTEKLLRKIGGARSR